MSDAAQNDRLSVLRKQQGWHATFRVSVGAPPPTPRTESVQIADVTPTKVSRLAVTVADDIVATLDFAAVFLTVESRVDEGVYRRQFQVFGQGVCCAIPQGRTVATLFTSATRNVPWNFFAVVGEGNVNTEWQPVSARMIALQKMTLRAVPYARRVRVSVIRGGPVIVNGQAICSLLAIPGGQTDYVIAASVPVELENASAAPTDVSVEWEVVA